MEMALEICSGFLGFFLCFFTRIDIVIEANTDVGNDDLFLSMSVLLFVSVSVAVNVVSAGGNSYFTGSLDVKQGHQRPYITDVRCSKTTN